RDDHRDGGRGRCVVRHGFTLALDSAKLSRETLAQVSRSTVSGLAHATVSIHPSSTAATAPATILRAVMALAGAEVIARAVAFAATAVLARRLGPDGFGVIGFAAAVCSYPLLAINSGLHDV